MLVPPDQRLTLSTTDADGLKAAVAILNVCGGEVSACDASSTGSAELTIENDSAETGTLNALIHRTRDSQSWSVTAQCVETEP